MATAVQEGGGVLDTWAIVEMFGHKQLAGKVSEHVIGSAALIRIDVPETGQQNGAGETVTKPAYTKLVGPSAIYAITPCTEAVARAAAERLERWNNPIPVDLPIARLPATASVAADLEHDGDEGDEDDDIEGDGFDGAGDNYEDDDERERTVG